MISAEFMVDCDVENQVAMAAEVDVLEPRPILPLRFLMEGMLRRSVVIPAFPQISSMGMVSWAALRLPVWNTCFDAFAPRLLFFQHVSKTVRNRQKRTMLTGLAVQSKFARGWPTCATLPRAALTLAWH